MNTDGLRKSVLHGCEGVQKLKERRVILDRLGYLTRGGLSMGFTAIQARVPNETLPKSNS